MMLPVVFCVERTARVSDVSIKIMAITVVTLFIMLTGAPGPKTSPAPPPNAEPSEEPLPDCIRTARISRKQITIWIARITVYIKKSPSYL